MSNYRLNTTVFHGVSIDRELVDRITSFIGYLSIEQAEQGMAKNKALIEKATKARGAMVLFNEETGKVELELAFGLGN